MNTISLPKHDASLHLEHNPHKAFYQTVAQWLGDGKELYEWHTAEQRREAFDTNEVWTLQWYPNNPVGFNAVAAPTLAKLLAYAAEHTDTLTLFETGQDAVGYPHAGRYPASDARNLLDEATSAELGARGFMYIQDHEMGDGEKRPPPNTATWRDIRIASAFVRNRADKESR